MFIHTALAGDGESEKKSYCASFHIYLVFNLLVDTNSFGL